MNLSNRFHLTSVWGFHFCCIATITTSGYYIHKKGTPMSLLIDVIQCFVFLSPERVLGLFSISHHATPAILQGGRWVLLHNLAGWSLVFISVFYLSFLKPTSVPQGSLCRSSEHRVPHFLLVAPSFSCLSLPRTSTPSPPPSPPWQTGRQPLQTLSPSLAAASCPLRSPDISIFKQLSLFWLSPPLWSLWQFQRQEVGSSLLLSEFLEVRPGRDTLGGRF